MTKTACEINFHDSSITAIDYDPKSFTTIVTVTFCNWAQPEYDKNESEVITVYLYFHRSFLMMNPDIRFNDFSGDIYRAEYIDPRTIKFIIDTDDENESVQEIKIVAVRLDGFGLFVEDMAGMIRFYRDVLGFEIKESEDTSIVYLVKDGTLFLLYGRKDFEKMTRRRYDYLKGPNGHFEIALYVDNVFKRVIENGATPVLEPTTEPWGQRTCCIADPEGNLIEIGSWDKPFDDKDKQ